MISKIKDWQLNQPQFKFDDSDSNSVIRIKDGIKFRMNFPYIHDDGIIHKDGTTIEIVYFVKFFNNMRDVSLQFGFNPSFVSNCEINNIFYKKDGNIEMLSFKDL